MMLVSCHPSCLNVLMQLAYQYLCNWRYLFSYTKTSVVAFGVSPAERSKNKQTQNWSLGPDHIDEEDEYVNLGVYKNIVVHSPKTWMRILPKQGERLVCCSQQISSEYDLFKTLEACLHSNATLWS